MATLQNCCRGTRMHKCVLLLALFTMTAVAKDDARVTYVGDGRYVCSNNNVACAQVDANSRQLESHRQSAHQREQDRAQAIVDRERRKGDDRRYGK